MDYNERKVQTFRFLNLLYDSVHGIADENYHVISTQFAQKLNLDYATTMELAHYLEGKRLIKVGIKAAGIDYRLISITEQGIKEVETARENKETPVEKYPPGTINQIVNYGPMIGSPIIQGSSNTSNVQSNVNIIDNDVQKIKKFIDSVRKEYQNYDLDHNKKSEIEADLNSMDSQILSPKPKVSILKEISLNVWDIVKPFASEAVKQVGMSLLGGS